MHHWWGVQTGSAVVEDNLAVRNKSHSPFDSAIPLLKVYLAYKLTLAKYGSHSLKLCLEAPKRPSTQRTDEINPVHSDDRIFCSCETKTKTLLSADV